MPEDKGPADRLHERMKHWKEPVAIIKLYDPETMRELDSDQHFLIPLSDLIILMQLKHR